MEEDCRFDMDKRFGDVSIVFIAKQKALSIKANERHKQTRDSRSQEAERTRRIRRHGQLMVDRDRTPRKEECRREKKYYQRE